MKLQRNKFDMFCYELARVQLLNPKIRIDLLGPLHKQFPNRSREQMKELVARIKVRAYECRKLLREVVSDVR